MTDDDPYERTRRFAVTDGEEVDFTRLDTIRVLVELSPEASPDPIAREAFLAAANLVTRLGPWCPNLLLRADDADLQATAMRLARDAIRPGDFRRDAHDERPCDVVLSIGRPTTSAPVAIQVGWDGWLALADVGAGELPHRGHLLAALLAVALGVARLQAHLLNVVRPGSMPDTPRSALNVYSLDASTDGPYDLRIAQLPPGTSIGAGAILDATAYALNRLAVSFPGDVVDHDNLTSTSSNRTHTATFAQCASGTRPKAKHVGGLFGANPHVARYEQWKVGRGPSRLAVVTVDDEEIRRMVAMDLPHTLLDASTGGTALAITRAQNPAHGCIGCAYPRSQQDPDDAWASRLGIRSDEVRALRRGETVVTAELLAHVQKHGRIRLTADDEAAALAGGWPALYIAGCGKATLDLAVPGASVSFLSFAAGVILATQLVREAIGDPLLVGPKARWVWGNVLGPTSLASFDPPFGDAACEERHALLDARYKELWYTGKAGTT